MWLCFFIEIEQHDYEKEEHHDGSCINDQVDNPEKSGVKQDVMSGDGKETDHQPKHAVDRILGEYHHQRGANGKCCKNKEGDRCHSLVSGAKIAEFYDLGEE